MTTAGGRAPGGEAADAADDRQATGRRRPWAVWRSPVDQPAWARPALLAVALVAALLAVWRAGTYLETYYAASVRSMSMSWHNFFFAAFDPAGTISLDKLPGAFWLQALAVRAFGTHVWANLLPQQIEGVCSVLILYRIVRRLAGPVAGIVAAGVLALSPATVALDRGNVADTLMVLLLLLAADSTIGTLTTNRWRGALLAGLWVGLAFEAKMVEAWIVLPALVLVVMVAAMGTWRQRLARVAAMVLVTVVVSLGWMTVVTLTPASGRPYVDGSQDNSLYQQVFVYNGLGRLDQASPDQLLTQSIGVHIPPPPPVAWNRLLTGSLGRASGWLLPSALVALVAGLAITRRNARGDPQRAGFLLWGAWLVSFAIAFSVGSSLNTYYTAALSPAIAGLLGGGVVLAWRRRRERRTQLAVSATVVGSIAYAVWLLPPTGTGLPGWLAGAAIAMGAIAVGALAVGAFATSAWGRAASSLVAVGLVAALAAVLAVPAVGAVSLAAEHLGPFDTPFQSAAVTRGVRAFFAVTATTAKVLPHLEGARHGAPYLMATQTSALAAPFIYASGQEVLPIGGFTGTIPSPTLAHLQAMIRSGRFHLVLQSPSATDPRLEWIARHCLPVASPTGPTAPSGPSFAIYYCLPGS